MDKELKKVSYISTVIGAIFLAVIIIFYLAYNYLSKNVYDMFVIICIVVSVLVFLLFTASFIIIITAYRIKDIGVIHAKLALFALKLTRPLIMLIAEVFKFHIEDIRRFFIVLNNIVISSLKLKFDKDKVLVILPHCLQYHECNIRVTGGIERCKDCGKCSLSEIKKICNDFGVKVVIVTGGTAARNIVMKVRPKVIVSVACERDLLSGIVEVGSIPVLGTINDRPQGPCFNTSVRVERLKQDLEKIL